MKDAPAPVVAVKPPSTCWYCGAPREPTCTPDRYWAGHGVGAELYRYDTSGCCAACFGAFAVRHLRDSPGPSICGGCGAEIWGDLGAHERICSFQPINQMRDIGSIRER